MFRPSLAARLAARVRQKCHAQRSRTFRPVQARSLASVAPPRPREPTERDKVTTLSNGIRVASEDLPDAFSGVGIYIDAGSRYENDYLRGASHIMDRLAFKSTPKRSAAEMMEVVDELGGNIQCASSRESMMYQAATFNSAIPKTVSMLAETIREPLLPAEEIEQQLATAAYEVREINSKPELILPELLHVAAFKDNTLGNPLLCPQQRLAAIDRNVIQAYRDTFYQPERIVVAFAGVPHVEAVRLTEQYFGDMQTTTTAPALSRSGSETSLGSTASRSSGDDLASSPSSSSSYFAASPQSTLLQQPSKLLSKIPFMNLSTSATRKASVLDTIPCPTHADLNQPSHYTGGMLSLPNLPVSTNPNQPNFTHIYLAFEGLPISSDDIYALATLQTLLGGGGSFSAGGPGKGMYSRLYTNVLNQHGWVESCMAFNHSYTDSGIFGIAASCSPGRAHSMLQVMCQELFALTADSGHGALQHVEVKRAKNQLRSSLLMNLESRMVELEDLGRQVQVHGHKVPVREMTRRIEALTPQDLRRVAKIVLGGLIENPGKGSGAPTVVLQEAEAEDGRVVPLGWDTIQDLIYKWKLGRR